MDEGIHPHTWLARGERGSGPLLELLDEFCKRGHLVLVNQLELEGEEQEVLEAGVEVGLLSKRLNHREVGMIDMRVHPEEPLEDSLDHIRKVSGEIHICEEGGGG